MKVVIFGVLALTLALSAATNAQSVSPTQFLANAGANDKSTQTVKQAAMADKLKPKPPMLDAKQAKDLATLRAANGTARDTF